MRTYQEKLDGLHEWSVWVFTKQDTDFDQSFRAAKLFSEMPEGSCIEDYFAREHTRYGITTDRHRMLVIPQLFGLITKTPFYARGKIYALEKPTGVFAENRALAIGSREYNIFKSEQLLKVKIHAVIDTAGNNADYSILPVPFLYAVLKKLKTQYGIDGASLGQIYTYVMTCKRPDELDEAVHFLAENAPVSKFFEKYKAVSRVLTFIKHNLSLFEFNGERVRISPLFEEYFDRNFAEKYDLAHLHEHLARDVDYAYFLQNPQYFGVDLIDPPAAEESLSLPLPLPKEDESEEYEGKVNDLDEANVREEIAAGAHKLPPVSPAHGGTRGCRINPLLGSIALKRANYRCAADPEHLSFPARKTGKPYMEAHHLIPACNQQLFWEKFNVNVDCLENLVSLCPTCHKAIHYGTDEVRAKLVEKLYRKCSPRYAAIGLKITKEELKKLYRL